MHHLAENANGYERGGAHKVALHVLPQLLPEITRQLGPKNPLQWNRRELLESDGPIALHRDRVNCGRITARNDDDAVARLKVTIVQTRPQIPGITPERLTILFRRGRCNGGRLRSRRKTIELRARRGGAPYLSVGTAALADSGRWRESNE